MTTSPSWERFWEKVDKQKGCWEWLGSKNKAGYGRFVCPDGIARQAHRISYELTVGKIPEGLTLDHLCRNRVCVRPNHLEPVTNRENVLRGIGPTAQNARKTHCPKGHPYIPENLTKGSKQRLMRQCRTCTNSKQLIRDRERRAKEKAARSI